MSDDWFTREEWSREVAEQFFGRLNRSKTSFHKAQFLRIQAHTLEQAGSPEPALELIDHLLRNYPEPSQLAPAHLCRAHALLRLGRVEEALAALRSALGAERDVGTIRTEAWLDFAELVVLRKLDVHYAAALDVLAQGAQDAVFPVQKFRLLGLLALLESAAGRATRARELAHEALGYAAERHSGRRYHPNIGLVSERHTPLLDAVSSLVAT